jgi:hypothetical protein
MTLTRYASSALHLFAYSAPIMFAKSARVAEWERLVYALQAITEVRRYAKLSPLNSVMHAAAGLLVIHALIMQRRRVVFAFANLDITNLAQLAFLVTIQLAEIIQKLIAEYVPAITGSN